MLATASGLSLFATPALAQTDPGDSDEIVVTAQKREENLQDVPIAVSAFSQEMLEERGLTEGADLQLAIPNVTFADTGFGRYSFQIRGVGALIQGASSDTGVGIHQNNIPLTVNRLASAEFYDLERVEVLRGPQGTLYGRNATGGLVNTITATPGDTFAGALSGEYGSFNRQRMEGFVNIPLNDTFAVRAAGTMIQSDGDFHNDGTGDDVNSADIWSTRLTAQWKPTDNIRIRGTWEHFDQDDSSGAGHVICAPDPGPALIGGVATDPFTRAMLSSGCRVTAADDPANNGAAPSASTIPGLFGLLFGTLPLDAFAGATRSSDLRTIETSFNPATSAINDLVSLDVQVWLTPNLAFTSLTAYSDDQYRALTPMLGAIPTSGFFDTPLTPGGVFSDPQIGASSMLDNRQLVRTSAEQLSQEFRLQSSFNGRWNFNVGGIYLEYDATNEVFIFANTTTQAAVATGAYVDPNVEPTGNPSEVGHNYYLNSTPYELRSSALFGEVYFDATDTLSMTLGLRYTNDDKHQTTYPIVLLAPGVGFPAPEEQRVEFSELTGRFNVDWRPELDFTDDTLIYASYARGYKGGGFNPGASTLSGVSPAFEPEFVDAYEIGIKNSLFDDRVTLNLTGFMYDYVGYQISQGVELTIATQNVDAEIRGLEVEAMFEPIEGLRFNTQIGYLGTEIAGGSSIDPNNPTAGDPTYAGVHSIDPGSFGLQCVVPVAELAGLQDAINNGFAPLRRWDRYAPVPLPRLTHWVAFQRS